MPEGHTLHRLAAELDVAFGGRPARVSSPQGRFAADAAVLDGQLLVTAESAGKHLFVEFAGDRFVHVHLGLIGKFDVLPGAAPAPVGQVRLRLQNDTSYADLRGAIECALVGRDTRDRVVEALGPDPLRPDAEPERAWRRIHRSDRALGDLLMDQAVLAGVGNVYRAEVLFRHRLDPQRAGRTLRHTQWDAVWADLVDLLAEGVRTGRIDTVRPEHTPEAMGRPARRDDHGVEVYVYRRNGQPCLVCGTTVRTTLLKGRNLFWCPRCQPRFRSRARTGV
ncbi:MAG: endonuclease [Streptomyces sp.]|nr:endonuclease [Streptomyces sp.]